MTKDKRVKACPTLTCKRYKKEYKYKATDNYCTICGAKLVYVCEKCFEQIEDEGTEKKRCEKCEAERQERRDAIKVKADKVKKVAVAGAAVLPSVVEVVNNPIAKTVVKKGASFITKKKM